jgi:uncharacterized protein (DUF302 family)
MKNDAGRCIVVDMDFEAAVAEVSRAIRDEGLQALARIDVRDEFWRDLRKDFRRYYLIEAMAPELAFETLRGDLDAGVALPMIFAVYELADGETAVVAKEPAERRERDRVVNVFARLERASAGPSGRVAA